MKIKNFFHIILLILIIFFLAKVPIYENTLLQLSENTNIERDYPIFNDDVALFYLESTNLKYIIYVKGLKKLDLSMLSFPNVELVNDMFGQLEGLTELKVPKMGQNHRFNNASLMFSDLRSIKTIDVTGIDFSRVGNFERMFYNCENLEEIKGVIDISAVGNTTSGWTDNDDIWIDDMAPPNINEMFFNCPKLKKVTIMDFRISADSNFRSLTKLNNTCELEIRSYYSTSGINAKIEVKSS